MMKTAWAVSVVLVGCSGTGSVEDASNQTNQPEPGLAEIRQALDTSTRYAAKPYLRQAPIVYPGAAATFPQTPAKGSVLVAVLSTATTAASFTPPPGWTLASTLSGFNVLKSSVYWKVAGDDEPRVFAATSTSAATATAAVWEYGGIPRAQLAGANASWGFDQARFVGGSLPAVNNALYVAVSTTTYKPFPMSDGWDNGFKTRSAYSTGNPGIFIADNDIGFTGTVAPTVMTAPPSAVGQKSAGFLLAFVSAPDPSPTPVPNVQLITAATDGTDQTATIQNQINAAPDGTLANPTLLRFPVGVAAGSYRVNGTLWISNRRNLILEGLAPTNKSRLWTAGTPLPLGRRHIKIQGSTNVTVRNLRIEDDNTTVELNDGIISVGKWDAAREGEHAFEVVSSEHVRLNDIEAYGVWGDGVALAGAYAPSVDVTVSGLTVSWNGRQGVSVVSAFDVLLEGITIQNGRRSSIDLEPNAANDNIARLEIRNFDFNQHLTHFAADGINDVSDVYIHDGTIRHYSNSDIFEVGSGNNTIRKNWLIERVIASQQFTNSPFARSKFTLMTNVVLRNNSFLQASAPGSAPPRIKAVTFGWSSPPLRVETNDFHDLCTVTYTTGFPTPVVAANTWGSGSVCATTGAVAE